MVETQQHASEVSDLGTKPRAPARTASMVWDAWGIPSGQKPLSAQIRGLLTQVSGVSGDPVVRGDEGDVPLRESTLTPARRDGLVAVVGADNVSVDHHDR